MRKISLKLLTQSELVVVNTNARTFGEFKQEVANLQIDWSSAKLIDRASKASFEMDEAILPAVDSIMFVMPTKSKAGASYQAELRTKIKELKENGVDVPFNYSHATNAQMEAFLASVESSEEEVTTHEEETVTDDVIYLKPGRYVVIVEGESIPKVVDTTTLEDLQVEAEELKRKF